MILGPFTIVVALAIVAIDRWGRLERPVAVALGGLGGALSGAGVLVGALYQPTTANIHSGYSFAGVVEWLLLAAGGGLLGAVAGVWLGSRAPSWRPAVAVLLLVAGAGAVGWILSAARTTIDCDERPGYCGDRYD